jgi:hypothetical protein
LTTSWPYWDGLGRAAKYLKFSSFQICQVRIGCAGSSGFSAQKLRPRAAADPFRVDRPAGRPDQEGEDADPGFGAGAHVRVDRAPVGQGAAAPLHRRPVDRHAEAFDAARLQRRPRFAARRFVGDHAPEVGGQRLGARGDEQRGKGKGEGKQG